MKAYTMLEMKNIVQYLTEHEAYGQTKDRKLWMNLAKSSLTDRSWQSLKENFQKRILPDIHNTYYGLSMEQIRSFRQGRDLTTKDVPLSQDVVPANDNSKNPRAISENMEAVNDAGEANSHSHNIRSSLETLMQTREERNAGEEDLQSNISDRSSSVETEILSVNDFSCQEGAESNECSENIIPTIQTATQPVVEDSDIFAVRVPLTQNRYGAYNSDSDGDVIPIRKNCSNTESRINKSLPLNNGDKSLVKNQINIDPSRKKQSSKDHSVSTKNVQSKSVLTSDSHHRNDEIAKALQETKRRNSLAYSNRKNSMTIQGDCQKTNTSENRDCHVRTINDSCDNENVRINGNPTCSKYMQPSLRSSLKDQSDKQSSTVRNSDTNKERVTKMIILNSQSDSDSDYLIEKQKRIKRRRLISRMPQLERENLQKILRMPLANLDDKGPRRKCNCTKTCSSSKNNTAVRQSDTHELPSTDEEMPVEPYKSPEEEREFWNQKYIDQDKKTNGILQSMQEISTKVDCQENAIADLKKQIAVIKNYIFIDNSSNEDGGRTTRTEDEDKENSVKIHIKTKSQDIRLKGDWKDICSDFTELLKVLKIVSPTKSNNNDATATAEELHDNELQSQAAANNVPVRRGNKPANKKRSPKGKYPRGNSKSKKNVEKEGNKKTQTPVRKSSRISMMKRKIFAEESDDGEQSDDRYYTPPKKINRMYRRNTIK